MPIYEGENGGPGGGGSPAFSIQVAVSGGDYSNPVDALNSIIDNSSSKRYCIKIAPGNYEIDNSSGPIALKDFVGMVACSIRSVIFTPSDPTQDMFTGANFAYMDGIVFSRNTTGYILTNNVSGTVNLNDCVLRDSGNGLRQTSSDGVLEIRRLIINNPSLTTTTSGIKIDSGKATLKDITARSTSIATTVIEISGSSTIATIIDYTCISPNVTTAIKIHSGALVSGSVLNLLVVYDGLVVYGENTTVRFDAMKIVNAQNDGFRIENVGSGIDFSLYSGIISQCGRYNFNIENPNCIVTGTGFTELEKSFRTPGASLYASLIDITEDDEGLNVLGELHVGTPSRGVESVMGEGDSYTSNMIVYTETSGGTFADVSEAARSASGSTFSFPGVGVDNSIYMASTLLSEDGADYLEHYGIKTKIDTAVDKGAGEIVFEFYNGASWEELNCMEVESFGSYYPKAKQYFENTGSFHIRYNVKLEKGDWVKNDPMSLGTDYYWVRARISSAITTSPVIEQFKLHTNRFEVNADGWVEYFGKARPLGTIPWTWGIFGGFFGGEMGNQPIYLSDNIYQQFSDNLWNSNGDKTGFFAALPLDFDTSSPLVAKWAVRPTFTGSVTWTVRWAYTSDGDTVYTGTGTAPAVHPTEQSLTLTESVVSGIQQTFTAELDVSNLVSIRDGGEGDILCVSIEMTTAGGDMAGFVLNPTYVKWCEGGHV